MKDLPVRKHPRLAGYNYSQNGAYFITFCVKGRHEMLGTVGRDALGAPVIQLSEYGEIVHKEIEETGSHYDGINIDKFVVMPNHIHMIISINSSDGAPRASRPTTALIPSIIAILKRKTNKAYGFNIWQNSFYDRIIRDEEEYQRVWRYIDENPAQWTKDEYYG